jgi:hypothetical protein
MPLYRDAACLLGGIAELHADSPALLVSPPPPPPPHLEKHTLTRRVAISLQSVAISPPQSGPCLGAAPNQLSGGRECHAMIPPSPRRSGKGGGVNTFAPLPLRETQRTSPLCLCRRHDAFPAPARRILPDIVESCKFKLPPPLRPPPSS